MILFDIVTQFLVEFPIVCSLFIHVSWSKNTILAGETTTAMPVNSPCFAAKIIMFDLYLAICLPVKHHHLPQGHPKNGLSPGRQVVAPSVS